MAFIFSFGLFGKSIKTIYGTDQDDTIFALGQNPIEAGAGNDQVMAMGNPVFGGDGDDRLSTLLLPADLHGGNGNDTLSGNFGNDQLFGDAGNDRLDGGFGNDQLAGGTGDDLIDGGWGNDGLAGEAGNDTLIGGYGNDQLAGGDGNDLLNAGDGNDALRGGDGNDTLIAGAGSDTLVGGNGDDTFVLAAAPGSSVTIADFQGIDEGGHDRIDFSALGKNLTWGGTTAGQGNIWYAVQNGNTIIYVDSNHDGAAEQRIVLSGEHQLERSDISGIANGAPIAEDFTVAEVAKEDQVTQLHGDAGALFEHAHDPDVGTTFRISNPGVYHGAYGTLTLNDDGSYNYQLHNDDPAVQALDAGQTVSDSFSYQVSDGSASDIGQIVFNIQGSAELVAIDDGVSTSEDQAVAIDVLFNDNPQNHAALSLAGAGEAAHGSVTANADRTISYTPEANWHGTDSFSYQVQDNFGNTASATVTVTVSPLNDAPVGDVAAALSSGTEDTVYRILATELLRGFSDVDGDTLTLANLEIDHGTLTDNGDGSWNFNPDTDYFGPVALSYSVIDGQGGKLEAQRTIDLQASNDAPTGIATARLSDGQENAALTLHSSDLLQGFHDVDGDTLSISGLHADHGEVRENGDGSWTLIPASDYSGQVNLVYTVEDGNGGSLAGHQILNLTAVNDEVHVFSISAPTVTEGSMLEFQVTLDGTTSRATPYSFELTGGSASPADYDLADLTFSNGVRYDASSGQIIVPSKVAQFSVSLPTVDDADFEPGPAESVSIYIDGNCATGAIADNDSPPPPPSDPEFQVNTGPVWDFSYPVVAALQDGGFVQLWAASNGEDYDIYGQRFDASGRPVGPENLINSMTAGPQELPEIVAMSDGGYLASWLSDDTIHLQRYDAAGEALGDEASVQAIYQLFPGAGIGNYSLAPLPDGGYVLEWLGDSPSGAAIQIQRYAADGIPLGDSVQLGDAMTQADDGSTTLTAFPNVAVLNDGSLVATWSQLQPNGTLEINLSHFDSDGRLLSEEVLANQQAGGQAISTVGALADGGYVLAWLSLPSDEPGEYLYIQQFTSHDEPVGEARLLAPLNDPQGTTSLEILSHTAALTGLVDGGYVVTWSNAHADGSGYDIYAQRFDPQGMPLSEATRVNTASDASETSPEIAALADGGYVISWQASSGSGFGIYAQRFDAAGHPLGGSSPLPEQISPTESDDLLSGSDRAEQIDGLSGNDRISGNAGNDTLIGNAGDDTLQGGSGNDYLIGDDHWQTSGGSTPSGGNDLLLGGNGNDTLESHDGNDTLLGGSGDDLLVGGDGDNLLDGGDGNDMLFGSAGRDIFVVTPGHDEIVDFTTWLAAGNDGDKLDFSRLGDPELHWNGTEAGAHCGWYQQAGDNTIVYFDTSGDGLADTVLTLLGTATLSAADVIGEATPAPMAASPVQALTANDQVSPSPDGEMIQWELGQVGSPGNAECYIVRDFDASGGKVLDLHSVLQGDTPDTLLNFLHISRQDGDTQIHVSTRGGFENGYSAATEDLTIVLQHADPASGIAGDQQIIHEMLRSGSLRVD